LIFSTRFPLGTRVEISFVNPGKDEATVTLTADQEFESYVYGLSQLGPTDYILPVEFRILDSGYGYVSVNSFKDNSLLTVELWERMIQRLNADDIAGLIIDMRNNGGGSGFLADQMAAYFFDEPLVLGNSSFYDPALGEFYIDPRGENRFYLPPEDLRYRGDVAVLVSPSCVSACEFFSYDMTLDDRATIVGQYPTAGAGGGIEDFLMPEGEYIRVTVSRGLDAEGNIHIEGRGVAPDVRVPVTEATLFNQGDPVLEAAVAYLDEH
jgi:C-terminal processing protease CtpA/Prc